LANALRVANQKQAQLVIYGDDYPTPDGTCIRDFIHVIDICQAHLLAMGALQKGTKSDVYNLGSDRGYSVREVIKIIEKVTGKRIPARVMARRAGDPAKVVASSDKAKESLGWSPRMGLEDIVASAWAWEKSDYQ
jgi:UDP-glucose 4-epimerase